MWSDVWPAMYGVVCLSILLEGGVTVSNNFTKRRQNGFKKGTRDKFPTHFSLEKLISNEIVIYTFFFLPSVIFAHMHFELGEPVLHSVLFCRHFTANSIRSDPNS